VVVAEVVAVAAEAAVVVAEAAVAVDATNRMMNGSRSVARLATGRELTDRATS
jgi:hypothetical protein